MRSKTRYLASAILAVVAVALQCTVAVTKELPLEAKVLAEDTIMYLRPVPLVSPNGKYVAFVSRGYVCVADIESQTLRQLDEVPGTWTHVFADASETSDGGSPDSLSQALGRDKYEELRGLINYEIGDFQWTVDSEAVIYSVSNYDTARQATQVRFWQAPLKGEPKEITSGIRLASTRRGPGGIISRDGRFLVGTFGRHRALIWDVTTNKPIATPFLHLAPSPTSGRWIGVEKDTRQLVVVDQDFNIVDRYDEILPDYRYGFKMIWSPDERFVFWREQIGFDYYSNWVGCRYDLQTRERHIFTGDYMREEITFTGHRGEFVRVGSKGVQQNVSGLAIAEHYVGLVPDGEVRMRRFWFQRADPPGVSSKVRMLHRGPNVTWSPDYELFTIGLPRQDGAYGEVYHLADRQRSLWKLPGADSGKYVSPYKVAGFALDGKVIVAYDDSRIFVVRVDAIQTPKNKIR